MGEEYLDEAKVGGSPVAVRASRRLAARHGILPHTKRGA
jgi:hypothetical protein